MPLGLWVAGSLNDELGEFRRDRYGKRGHAGDFAGGMLDAIDFFTAHSYRGFCSWIEPLHIH